MAQARPVVVLIEDDASILRALTRLLTSCGLDVLAFSRPEEVMRHRLPDQNACLVVDLYLQEMNGVDLCQALNSAGCHLPVILMTARTDEEARNLTKLAGPVPVLLKPFTRDALLTEITRALYRT